MKHEILVMTPQLEKNLEYFFDTYKPLALRTASGHRDFQRDLNHSILGIITELNELDLAESPTNTLEEKGDLCWYIALGLITIFVDRIEDSSFHFTRTRPLNFEDTCKILDHLKRAIYYHSESDYFELVRLMWYILVEFCGVCNEGFIDILDKNIAKLRVRYPEKFDEEKALNRDLAKENDVLSRDQ